MVLICAMVQYFAFGERLMFYSTRLRPPPPRGFASLNRTSIFHRMRNIVPLHRSKPLAICVVQHLEYQRNWRRLIRISYLGWVKFNFSPSWLNIASAHDQSVTRISFTKQFLCARRSRKSTLIRSAVIVTSCHCWEWYETARPLNGTQLLNGWAPIGAYTTSFLGVVQLYYIAWQWGGYQNILPKLGPYCTRPQDKCNMVLARAIYSGIPRI